MSGRPPRIAAIGAGVWGRNIIRALKYLEAEGVLELIAVVDVREDIAKSVAREWRVPYHATGLEDLRRIGVDAVTVAVPISYLPEVTLKAINEGYHVFVEKPVATRPEQVERIMEVAKDAGLVVQPGFIVRYDPVAQALRKEIIKRGRPTYMLFKRLSARPPHRRDVSVVFDLMIHDIDLTGFFVGWGDYDIVSAWGVSDSAGVPQSVCASVTIEDTHVSFIADGFLPVKVREVEASLPDVFIRGVFTDRVVQILSGEGMRESKVSGEEPLKAELRDFARRVRGEEVPNAPTIEDALNACRLARSVESVLKLRSEPFSYRIKF